MSDAASNAAENPKETEMIERSAVAMKTKTSRSLSFYSKMHSSSSEELGPKSLVEIRQVWESLEKKSKEEKQRDLDLFQKRNKQKSLRKTSASASSCVIPIPSTIFSQSEPSIKTQTGENAETIKKLRESAPIILPSSSSSSLSSSKDHRSSQIVSNDNDNDDRLLNPKGLGEDPDTDSLLHLRAAQQPIIHSQYQQNHEFHESMTEGHSSGENMLESRFRSSSDSFDLAQMRLQLLSTQKIQRQQEDQYEVQIKILTEKLNVATLEATRMTQTNHALAQEVKQLKEVHKLMQERNRSLEIDLQETRRKESILQQSLNEATEIVEGLQKSIEHLENVRDRQEKEYLYNRNSRDYYREKCRHHKRKLLQLQEKIERFDPKWLLTLDSLSFQGVKPKEEFCFKSDISMNGNH